MNKSAKEYLIEYITKITESEAKELLLKFKNYLEPHTHYSDDQYKDYAAKSDKQYKG